MDESLLPPIDLIPTFEDKFRQFIVQHLAEYQPPR